MKTFRLYIDGFGALFEQAQAEVEGISTVDKQMARFMENISRSFIVFDQIVD